MENVDETIVAAQTPLAGKSSDASIEMAAESKEISPNEPTVVVKQATNAASSSGDDSIFSLVYSIVKKVTIVGAIYLVGYMNWSVAWLITPVVFAVTREYWRKTSDSRREIAKASAVANEKDVILARITDLPAWVINIFIFLYLE